MVQPTETNCMSIIWTGMIITGSGRLQRQDQIPHEQNSDESSAMISSDTKLSRAHLPRALPQQHGLMDTTRHTRPCGKVRRLWPHMRSWLAHVHRGSQTCRTKWTNFVTRTLETELPARLARSWRTRSVSEGGRNSNVESTPGTKEWPNNIGTAGLENRVLALEPSRDESPSDSAMQSGTSLGRDFVDGAADPGPPI